MKYFYNGANVQLPSNGNDNLTCPNCRRYNAMLFDRECNQPSDDHVLKCRDCNAEVIVLVISDVRPNTDFGVNKGTY